MIYPTSVFHKNEKEKTLCPSVIFDKGDVRMTNAFPEDFSKGIVHLKNDVPTEIGELNPTNDNPPDMIWVFTNPNSLGAVIMQLQELQYSMENKTLFHPKG